MRDNLSNGGATETFNHTVKSRLHQMIAEKKDDLRERDIENFCDKEGVPYNVVDRYMSNLIVPSECRGCQNVNLYPSVPPCTSCKRVERADNFKLDEAFEKGSAEYEVRVRDDPDVKVLGIVSYYVLDRFSDRDLAITHAEAAFKEKQNGAKVYIIKVNYDADGNIILEEMIWVGYHPHAGEATVWKEKK